MTTIVVATDAPADALDGLCPPLETDEAHALYEAMFVDACETVQHGEADLLVNHPDGTREHLQTLLNEELPRADEVRFEPQVGSSQAAVVGNALTHLLDREDERMVAAMEPTAPFLRREHIGTTAMKLRKSDVVLGPAPAGRLTFVGLTQSLDFTDIYESPALETATRRAVEAGHEVDFLPMTPRVDTERDLTTALSLLTARQMAGRLVPPRTTAVLTSLDLTVESDGHISRDSARE